MACHKKAKVAFEVSAPDRASAIVKMGTVVAAGRLTYPLAFTGMFIRI